MDSRANSLTNSFIAENSYLFVEDNSDKGQSNSDVVKKQRSNSLNSKNSQKLNEIQNFSSSRKNSIKSISINSNSDRNSITSEKKNQTSIEVNDFEEDLSDATEKKSSWFGWVPFCGGGKDDTSKPFKKSYTSVIEQKDGKLTAKDPLINTILQCCDLKPNATLEKDTTLTVTLDPKTSQACETLRKHYTPKVKLYEHKGSTKEETEALGTSALIPILQEFILRGKTALGEKKQIPDQEQNLVDPYQQLSSLEFDITSTDEVLQKDIKKVIEDKANENPDFKAKLGAAMVNQIATNTEYELLNLAMSMGLSITSGVTWSALAAPKVEETIKNTVGQDAVSSLLAFGVESGDTAIVQTMMKAQNKEKIEPKELAVKAIQGGAISTVGTFINNNLQRVNTGVTAVDVSARLFGSMIQMLSAAAGVPMEIQDNKAKMDATLVQAIQDGSLTPRPDEPVKQYVKRLSEQAVRLSPGNQVAQRSIFWAALVCFIPPGLERLGWISKGAQFAMDIAVFQPWEIESMNALTGLDKVGFSKFLTSADQKHSQVLQLIFNEAFENKVSAEKFGELMKGAGAKTEGELKAILDQAKQSNRWINKLGSYWTQASEGEISEEARGILKLKSIFDNAYGKEHSAKELKELISNDENGSDEALKKLLDKAKLNEMSKEWETIFHPPLESLSQSVGDALINGLSFPFSLLRDGLHATPAKDTRIKNRIPWDKLGGEKIESNSFLNKIIKNFRQKDNNNERIADMV